MVSALISTTSCLMTYSMTFLPLAGTLMSAIVFVSGELALDEDLSAFDKTAGQSFKSWPKTNDLVPLAFLLPLVVLVLPGFLGRDAELGDGGAIGSCWSWKHRFPR